MEDKSGASTSTSTTMPIAILILVVITIVVSMERHKGKTKASFARVGELCFSDPQCPKTLCRSHSYRGHENYRQWNKRKSPCSLRIGYSTGLAGLAALLPAAAQWQEAARAEVSASAQVSSSGQFRMPKSVFLTCVLRRESRPVQPPAYGILSRLGWVLPKCSISGSRPSNRRMWEQDLRMEPSEACVKFCIQVEVVLEWSQGLLNMIRTVCDMELL